MQVSLAGMQVSLATMREGIPATRKEETDLREA
jgi:hypothetical protein